MRVTIAAVGRSPRGPLARVLAEYEARARHYFDLEVLEVDPASGRGADPARIRERETRALLARVPEELERVALSRRGRGMTSRGLTRYLAGLRTYGRPGVAFLIGGAEGLGPEALRGARHRLSLSPMTLPHALARLVLTEQIYRAGTILRGEPYHRGGVPEGRS